MFKEKSSLPIFLSDNLKSENFMESKSFTSENIIKDFDAKLNIMYEKIIFQLNTIKNQINDRLDVCSENQKQLKTYIEQISAKLNEFDVVEDEEPNQETAEENIKNEIIESDHLSILDQDLE